MKKRRKDSSPAAVEPPVPETLSVQSQPEPKIPLWRTLLPIGLAAVYLLLAWLTIRSFSAGGLCFLYYLLLVLTCGSLAGIWILNARERKWGMGKRLLGWAAAPLCCAGITAVMSVITAALQLNRMYAVGAAAVLFVLALLPPMVLYCRFHRLMGKLVTLVCICFAAGYVIGLLINHIPGDGAPNTKVWYPYLDYAVTDNAVYESTEGFVLDGTALGEDGYVIELEKHPDKDFVVLNLTDLQKFGIEFFFGNADLTERTVRQLVKEVQPDLITLSGDQTWGSGVKAGMGEVIRLMDSFGIPWAPVFGNHDGEKSHAPNNLLADLYLESEHCIFRKGPGNIGGVGNYVINITENGRVIHSLIMMDSHSSAPVLGKDGNVTRPYASILPAQMDWYEWVINGIAEQEGHTVESTAIFHIPLYEYRIADEAYRSGRLSGFGENGEPVCAPEISNGFFDRIKALGSTRQILVGHDHLNSAVVEYEGVTLAYSLKTGDGCYWNEDGSMNGGTVLRISGEGCEIAHHYIAVD